MKKLHYLGFLLLIFSIFLMSSCGGEKKLSDQVKDEKNENANSEEGEDNVNPAVSKEVLADIIKSIPSPIEISFLIKDLGINYDNNILNDAEKSSKYNTDFKRALNLGIYSTDLGYANIYEQKQDAIKYLNSVKEMADGLKIGDFFDFQTIRKLATKNNLDSLLMVTTMNLENINEHLQKKGRADLTIIILTGGWLEALYLSCEVAKKKPNKLLDNRIGEQGIILDQLLLLLSFYENEVPNIKSLIDDLHKLKKIYDDNVKIEYTYTDTSTPEVDENGILMGGEGTTQSEITFTKEDLDSILQVTKEVRQKIID